jgi:hypothetical protein
MPPVRFRRVRPRRSSGRFAAGGCGGFPDNGRHGGRLLRQSPVLGGTPSNTLPETCLGRRAKEADRDLLREISLQGIARHARPVCRSPPARGTSSVNYFTQEVYVLHGPAGGCALRPPAGGDRSRVRQKATGGGRGWRDGLSSHPPGDPPGTTGSRFWMGPMQPHRLRGFRAAAASIGRTVR